MNKERLKYILEHVGEFGHLPSDLYDKEYLHVMRSGYVMLQRRPDIPGYELTSLGELEIASKQTDFNL